MFINILGVLAIVGVCSQRLEAVEMDVPLAVTGLAHPSLISTPTGDEVRKSDDYLKAGLIFLKNNLPERAVSEFNDSVRMAPRAENYKALGTAYYQAGNQARAIWAYRQSIQLKPDEQVQALVDSLEGKDHPEERFKDLNDETRFARLMKSAARHEKKGRRDSAIRDYADAYALKADPDARRPIAGLSAGLAEEYIRVRSADRAIEVMVRAKHVYANAKDLDPQELDSLARLERAEAQVTKLTGERLREHEIDMQTDMERWRRKVREIEASKGGGHIHIDKN
ncbi:MAG: hypothetical protein V4498_03755 [candidate division FCPU426 bacterium]